MTMTATGTFLYSLILTAVVYDVGAYGSTKGSAELAIIPRYDHLYADSHCRQICGLLVVAMTKAG